jgi:hypothetical protein
MMNASNDISVMPKKMELLRARVEAEMKVSAKVTRETVPSKPVPNISDVPCLVAYIDILGFGSEITKATTPEALQKAYTKIKTVQEQFLHPSASSNSSKTLSQNEQYGRRVYALSDAVIVVFDPICEMASINGFGDLFKLMFYDLVLGQCGCVDKGIFVRGALSVGSFHFEDDILLSPALAHAYALESKGAVNPVIVMTKSVRKEIEEAAQMDPIYEQEDSIMNYFIPYGRRKWKGEQLYFLNYLNIMENEAVIPWSPEELAEKKRAQELGQSEQVDELYQKHAYKSSALYLKQHRHSLETAFNSAKDPKVGQKYLWLMKYHNKCCPQNIVFVKDQRIDVSRYERLLSKKTTKKSST